MYNETSKRYELNLTGGSTYIHLISLCLIAICFHQWDTHMANNTPEIMKKLYRTDSKNYLKYKKAFQLQMENIVNSGFFAKENRKGLSLSPDTLQVIRLRIDIEFMINWFQSILQSTLKFKMEEWRPMWVDNLATNFAFCIVSDGIY